MRKISKIEPKVPVLLKRKRVAAYARVSRESERMDHSLSAQVSYYSSLIQKNSEWEYAGVYADYGISGTGMESREEFMRLLADCETGKIDIILTKSIQRFARNTVDLLNTVRHLRDIGVEVQFEKEHIHSLSGDGELMMTILASFAQEESRSISENVKWAIRKSYEQGKPHSNKRIFGYDCDGKYYTVIPEEAKTVQFIYSSFLEGKPVKEIEKTLEEMGIQSLSGGHFGESQIRKILENERYAGDMRLQKYYVEDHISHREVINRGELPQYYVEDTHEAIISREDFQKVQEELKRRRALGIAGHQRDDLTCFTGRIICGKCGRRYHRKNYHNKIKDNYHVWKCHTKAIKGETCTNHDIRESHLLEFAADVLGLDTFDADVFNGQIEKVVVVEPRDLLFYFYDGRVAQRHCEMPGHKGCWTPEMRARHSAFMSEENVRRWEARRNAKKGDNDSGVDQPVHGNADQQSEKA